MSITHYVLKVLIISGICFSGIQAKKTANPPRLAVVLVIDQCAYNLLQKLEPYLKYGFKSLLNKGMVYTNAYYPHFLPETAPGHADLSTGALPKDHGIVANAWYNAEGQEINADDDFTNNALVFLAQGPVGKSSVNLMVDGLSDQFMLASRPVARHNAIAVSFKSRAATALASKMGKAIWFDDALGLFTTSRAYFTEIPEWVNSFNETKKINEMQEFTWNLCYKRTDDAYSFDYINSYSFASNDFPLAGRTTIIDHAAQRPFEQFIKIPQANEFLFELALDCVDEYLKNKTDSLLLWVSLSSLDKCGHTYGQQSLEIIDMVYHLDAQIQKFLKALGKRVKQKDMVLALTADHGMQPLVEITHKQGFTSAQRIMVDPLIASWNEQLDQLFTVSGLIQNFQPAQLYFNKQLFNELDAQQQTAVTNELKTLLAKQPGIKRVWGSKELLEASCTCDSIEQFFKNQIYAGRSGDIFFQVDPYVDITIYAKGAAHASSYNYNTHVPLILWQKGVTKHAIFDQKVTLTQLPATLAHFLAVPRPSACFTELLPGI